MPRMPFLRRSFLREFRVLLLQRGDGSGLKPLRRSEWGRCQGQKRCVKWGRFLRIQPTNAPTTGARPATPSQADRIRELWYAPLAQPICKLDCVECFTIYFFHVILFFSEKDSDMFLKNHQNYKTF
jgi:hypothetical protein